MSQHTPRALNQYPHGGRATYAEQMVGRQCQRSEEASSGTGGPGQRFEVLHPPVLQNVLLVNRDPDDSVTVMVENPYFRGRTRVRTWLLAGRSIASANRPGRPDAVAISTRVRRLPLATGFRLRVPAHSVLRLRIPAAR